MVLLYIVSDKQLISHVTKLKCAHTSSTSVDACEQQQMYVLHFSTNHFRSIRIFRNADSNDYLPAIDFWNTPVHVAGIFDPVLYFRRVDFNQLTTDRIILFKQIRI